MNNDLKVRPWDSIPVRLGLGLLLVSLAAFALTLVIVVRQEERQSTEAHLTAAQKIAAVTAADLSDQMMVGGGDAVWRAVSARTRLHSHLTGASPILVLNKDGVVKAGSDSALIGTRLATQADAACPACDSVRPQDFPASAIVTTGKGARQLRVVNLIPVTQACQSCHSGDAQMHAYVTIDFDLSDFDRGIAERRLGILWVSLLAGLAMVALTALLFRRLVMRPVHALMRSLQRLASGDLGARTVVQGRNELSLLAQGFNNMLAQIRMRDDELARHRDHLEEEVTQRTASLTEAQRITTQIIETIPLRVFWKDRKLRYLGCNTLFAKDAGLARPDELIGKNDFDMGWRDQAELYRADDRQVMDSNTPKLSYDEPQTTPDGGRIWLRTSKVPLRNEANETFGILGVYEDISRYKQVELRLLESEQRFRVAFQNSAIGMALVGLDGCWFKVNDSLCKIVGYPEQELLGKTFQDITYPDDLQTDLEFMAQLLAGTRDHYQMEKRYVHKDGHVVWIRLSVSLIRDAENRPVHFVAQIDDITEDKLAEEKIRKLNEELETKVQQRTQQLLQAQDELVRKGKLAVLGQVAGSVGHELRNPLGVMSNAVYFLQTVLADADATTKEYLDIIKSEITGSERIVSDLLDSVRTKPPHPEMVGLAELIGQTLRKYSVPSSVTVKLEIPESLPPLRVDPLQIQQVLCNLISNGVEAMPDGGTLEISALENRPDGSITVRVRDSGVGMTPEQLGKLFQPLFTTKARGIGLGLVVVKNLAQANGGSVQVESQLGKGSVFTVTLPAVIERGK